MQKTNNQYIKNESKYLQLTLYKYNLSKNNKLKPHKGMIRPD